MRHTHDVLIAPLAHAQLLFHSGFLPMHSVPMPSATNRSMMRPLAVWR
jgi:hypothetical protein